MVNAALRDRADGDYASANNRAYYSIFHAMRAVLAMEQKGLWQAFRCNC